MDDDSDIAVGVIWALIITVVVLVTLVGWLLW